MFNSMLNKLLPSLVWSLAHLVHFLSYGQDVLSYGQDVLPFSTRQLS